MVWGEIPPVVEDNKNVAAEVQIAENQGDLFNEIFGRSSKPPQEGASISNLGRIEQMSLPPAWVAGTDTNMGTGYMKTFHPKEKGSDGVSVDRDDVQMQFSYRGHRLNNDASNAFRALIDSAPADGSARLLTPRELQQPPLNEVLGDRGNKNLFNLVSAKVQLVNGEPALIVEGKYAKHEVNARVVYIDAERAFRNERGAPVQEMAYVAPTKEFFKFSPAANDAFNKINWKK